MTLLGVSLFQSAPWPQKIGWNSRWNSQTKAAPCFPRPWRLVGAGTPDQGWPQLRHFAPEWGDRPLNRKSGPRNVAAGDPARHRDMLRLTDKCSAADLKS